MLRSRANIGLYRYLSVAALSLAVAAAHADVRDLLKQRGIVLPSIPKKQSDPNDAASDAKVDQITGLVGLTAMGVCSKKVQDDQKKQAICLVGGLAATTVTNLIGKKIAAGLKERDQREVLSAASESLQTGEPMTVTLPESGATLHVTPSAEGQQKSMRVPIHIDSALVNAELPTLHVIGSAYRVNKKSNLHGAPQSSGPTVGTLAKDENVHVLGKAGETGQLLVARWVMSEGDLFPEPMAVGYAASEQLAAAESPDAAQGQTASAPATRKLIDANVVVTCRDIAMKREDTDGKVIEDKALRCNGPAGIPLDG